MFIVHVAAEFAPIAKVGGLGDVTLGLPMQLKREGHIPIIVIPKYKHLNLKPLKKLSRVLTFKTSLGTHDYTCHLYKGYFHKLEVYLIETTSFFKEKNIYVGKKDIERFSFFCKAVENLLKNYFKKVDILHLHDWHTAPLAYLYKQWAAAPVILTVHNFAYQGKCPISKVKKLGIQETKGFVDPHHKSSANFLHAGIYYSDFITTVSPTFAKEALTKEGGKGLEKLLQKRKSRFKGILNGVDYEIWDLKKDPYIIQPKNHKHTNKGWIQCKEKNKEDLQKKAHITKQTHFPLIGCITRLVPQKGPFLIQHAIQYTLKKGGQFVLLGSSATPKIKTEFNRLAKKCQKNKNAHIELKHSEKLAHKIYAGSDLLIIPSIFEPCGLTQLIAMHFGTLPIARKTGGLADTVVDIRRKKANGILFEKPMKKAVEKAIDRAFALYEKKALFKKLQNNALRENFDWKRSCKQYLAIYKKL